MPSWSEILEEVQSTSFPKGNGRTAPDFGRILFKYLSKLSQYRGRNVIVYYSDWLNQTKLLNLDINDGDMEGFMNAIYGLDRTKGLDVILHTPGGSPLATEGIVKYLHKMFGRGIEVFVPHMAMSAGTMFCCACTKVWMGKQSFLGPIDPQFSGVPAYNIKKEFEDAKRELVSNPETFRNWQILLSKYSPAFYYTVLDAIDLSSKLVENWLLEYMFGDNPAFADKAKAITRQLNMNTGSHSKHFDIDDCRNIGLKVSELESDDRLQDIVLSAFHCLTIMGNATNICKVICNHAGKSYIVHNGSQGGAR